MIQNNLKKRPDILFFYNLLLFVVILAPVTLTLNTAYAGYKDDIEFTRLQEELNLDLPDGNGIQVTQIEAGDVWMPARPPHFPNPTSWMPPAVSAT